MTNLYLDYNATAPLRPEVIQRMQEIYAQPANASSVHSFGRNAKKHLEDARKTIAESISAFPNEIIFMGSGTEANIAMLRGFPDRRVLASAVEHSSVLKQGEPAIAVDANGVVELAALDRLLAATPNALVSVMLANNETGVIQPIKEIAAMCKKHGALLHSDAVQALGKMPLDFTALGIDAMTISAHKMGGPVGSAALVIRQNLAVKPLFTGGGQELGRRAGTENIAAIAGFAKAIELIDLKQMHKLRDWLDQLENVILSGAHSAQSKDLKIPRQARDDKVVFGKSAPRLPNTTCLALPGVTQEVMLMKLDLAGIAISAGSACSSGRIEPSHVLLAMGVNKAVAGSAIRISGGWNTTEADIKQCGDALAKF